MVNLKAWILHSGNLILQAEQREGLLPTSLSVNLVNYFKSNKFIIFLNIFFGCQSEKKIPKQILSFVKKKFFSFEENKLRIRRLAPVNCGLFSNSVKFGHSIITATPETAKTT